jgi:hypothetical protein
MLRPGATTTDVLQAISDELDGPPSTIDLEVVVPAPVRCSHWVSVPPSGCAFCRDESIGAVA